MKIINDAKNSVSEAEKNIEMEYLKKQEMILNFKENMIDFKKNVKQRVGELLEVLDKMEWN